MAKTSETAAVETLEAKLKRSFQMKMFFNDVQKAKLSLNKAENKPDAECEAAGGTIIGRIFEVKEKQGELPNGETNISLVAIGEFECVKYETGEIFEAPAAYLPGYYLESAKAALEKMVDGNAAIELAAEILCVATGKSVPFAYEIRNLIPREANSPMNKLKQRLAAAGKLRGLPPPIATLALDGPVPAEVPAPAESEAA